MRLLGKNQCPDEAELSAYLERTLTVSKQAAIEQHLAECDECRESVALLVYLEHRVADGETAEASPIAIAQPDSEQIKAQTAKVMFLIAEDERKQSSRRGDESTNVVSLWRRKLQLGSIRLPAPAMAAAAVLVMLLAGVIGYQVATHKSPEDSSLEYLAKAMERDGRRQTKALVAGIGYSGYDLDARGGSDAEPVAGPLYDTAQQQVVNGDSPTAALETRIVRAKALIAGGKPEDIAHGRAILEDLAAKGTRTAELFNDLGAARYAMSEYSSALDSFNEAISLNPNMTTALFNRALVAHDLALTSPTSERNRLHNLAKADLERLLQLLDPAQSKWAEDVHRVLELVNSDQPAGSQRTN